MKTLKKVLHLKAVNETLLAKLEPAQTIVRLCLAEDCDVEAKMDEICFSKSIVMHGGYGNWIVH